MLKKLLSYINQYKTTVFGLTALLLSLVFLFDVDFFLWELGHSWAFHGIFLLLLLAIFFFKRKLKLVGLICFSGFLMLVLQHYHYFNPSHAREESIEARDSIAAAHFNVLRSNRNFEQLINTAKGTNADLIVFQEVDTPWERALKKQLADQYPYHKFSVRKDNYGVALFSKHPFQEIQVLKWAGLPTITGKINIDGAPLRFTALHAKSPVLPYKYKIRNEQFEALIEHSQQTDLPHLVMGDLNVTPWANEFRAIMNKTNLNMSRQDFSPTFPAMIPFLRIPIDYVLHSNSLRCHSFKVLKEVSSDHFGVVGRYVTEMSKRRGTAKIKCF